MRFFNLDLIWTAPVELFLTDWPYVFRRRKDKKHSAFEEIVVSDMKEKLERVTDVLHQGGHADLLCTAQQFVVRRGLFAAAPPTQHEGSSFSLSPVSKGVFMVSAAHFTFVGHLPNHRSSS